MLKISCVLLQRERQPRLSDTLNTIQISRQFNVKDICLLFVICLLKISKNEMSYESKDDEVTNQLLIKLEDKALANIFMIESQNLKEKTKRRIIAKRSSLTV